jgi:hypothetical protein
MKWKTKKYHQSTRLIATGRWRCPIKWRNM